MYPRFFLIYVIPFTSACFSILACIALKVLHKPAHGVEILGLLVCIISLNPGGFRTNINCELDVDITVWQLIAHLHTNLVDRAHN